MSDHTEDLLARIDDDLSVSLDAMRSVPAGLADSVPEPAHPFGTVIDAYSRADAIADGMLRAVPEGIAREAGFRVPVALTSAVWEDCVAWSDEDSARQTPQDEDGRLWDVLFMSAQAARRGGSDVLVSLYRVPRGGRARAPRLVNVRCVIGPGDTAAPVITIMQPDED
ncbi:DUF6573 family protein [Streptomyces sp. NPDC006475]|uniref:DUF6573 family protein n=1 Tax=Streptomyces sp. NPDC006475 TaxID=3155719 RepID=UPI0033ADC283